MSMFRRPGDSSSSSESSDGQTEDDEVTGTSQQDSVLSRINTLDSATSNGPSVRPQPPRLDVRQNSTQNVRDLLLHSLLEERTLRDVAAELGKDTSDPEVQRLGRQAYQEVARQISSNVDGTYAGDNMQGHRSAANVALNNITKSNISKLSIIPELGSQVLVARAPNKGALQLLQQPSVGFHVLSGIPTPPEIHLPGYPGLQTDRYAREFSELATVGKGGYGKVYKARHNLDGSVYAVKRIPISPTKLARVQAHGPQELESMLEEVRSLARFEHANVVRYHNAWLEFTTVPTEVPVVPEVTTLRDDRLLEGSAIGSAMNIVGGAGIPSADLTNTTSAGNLSQQFNTLDFDDDPFERSDHGHDADIVFETSDSGAGVDDSRNEPDNMSLKETLMRSGRKNRRGSQASQATMATISSTKSRITAVEDFNGDEDDEVEMIPRTHAPYSQDSTSELSESMVSHSDVPAHLVQSRNLTGPILTLNVQMSLCETNLASFLSMDHSAKMSPIDRHCFHPCVSLELLSNIVSGVQYLHNQGVVHRDLKPANVFLSVSSARHAPYGSINVSNCKPCCKEETLHITPRIGDFGLVAALSEKCVVDNGAKLVGTEFYRPQTSSSISEKLDVYALGVVGFEMLQQFGTKMERVTALTEFRHGLFPARFVSGAGDLGGRIQQMISAMVETDERQRWGCDEVYVELEELVAILRR